VYYLIKFLQQFIKDSLIFAAFVNQNRAVAFEMQEKITENYTCP
jgi:hypothetical protein